VGRRSPEAFGSTLPEEDRLVALQSQLFRDNPKLEAAAVSDPAHIVPGARGDHVRKIQLALIELDGADIDSDGIYGPATAAAVLAYKQKRQIINRSYQQQADNIVGKMTMAALDRDMLKAEAAMEEIAVWCAVASVLGYNPHFQYIIHNDQPLRQTVSTLQESNKTKRV
jgi:peptidoglycan hydrolase-like protein with peptidoglycan-binding domain